MKKTLKAVLVASLLILPTLAFAAHYADFYVIPVVSKTSGVNGTQWMSDVAVQNFSGSEMTVSMTFIESGEGRADNVTPVVVSGATTFNIRAGGSLLIRDVLKDIRPNGNAIGSLLIGSDRAFAVTSRSYSMSPSGDTVGQTVLPARDFLENAVGITNNAMATAYIPGLISNDRFRTNLGFVAASGNLSSTMGVEFRLKDSTGSTIGSRTFAVAPGNFTHVQFSSKSLSTASFDIGSVEVRITQGSGAVVPYASVIDNVTADAVYVTGQFPPNTARPKAGSKSIFQEMHEMVHGSN